MAGRANRKSSDGLPACRFACRNKKKLASAVDEARLYELWPGDCQPEVRLEVRRADAGGGPANAGLRAAAGA